MIGICISSAWPQYYAASPYNNIMMSDHPRFKHMECLPHEIDQAAVNECEAIITDDVLVDSLGFYNRGPKLVIGGDLHAHDAKGVNRRELDFIGSDYVLSGGLFAPELKNYKYFDKKYRSKIVYLPNCVPDNKYLPELPTWADRLSQVQISGSISDVYPYRRDSSARCVKIPALPRGYYFSEIAKYKAGLTCNSVLIYTVAKYFEIPWVGSLLIAKEIQPVEQELLGFNDENCIFTDTPGVYIDMVNSDMHNVQFNYMAIQCQRLVQERHTAYQRLEYISLIVDAMVKGNFNPYDALEIFKGLK